MADVREQRIYCAEQIVVPEELPNILKHYSKAVIKENPANIVSFSAKYFRNLLDQQNNKAKDHIEKPDSHHWSWITYLYNRFQNMKENIDFEYLAGGEKFQLQEVLYWDLCWLWGREAPNLFFGIFWDI